MRIVGAAALASALALGVAAPVAAEEPISNTLPAFVTGPTTFEVKVAAVTPVCAMTYGTQERTTAPWTFTFDPVVRTSMVRVDTCQGTGFNYYLSPLPELAYFASRNDEVREAGHKTKIFVINNVELPGTVRVVAPDGKILAKGVIEGRSTALTFTLPKISTRLADVKIVMSSDDGTYVVNQSVQVSRGWARIFNQLPIVPCSTVIWRYRDSDRPFGAQRAKVEADLQAAMKRITAASGVNFRKAVDDQEFLEARASISIGWRALLGTVAAEGDGSTTKEPSGYRTKGQVWLNALAPGMSDRYSGAAAGKKGAAPGRVWPMTHALLHIMGLEHTGEKGNVMYMPVVGPSGLGAGDRFALNYLYAPASCR